MSMTQSITPAAQMSTLVPSYSAWGGVAGVEGGGIVMLGVYALICFVPRFWGLLPLLWGALSIRFGGKLRVLFALAA